MTWFVTTSDIIGLIVFSAIVPPIATLWLVAGVSERLGSHNPAPMLALWALVTIALWAGEAAALNWWLG